MDFKHTLVCSNGKVTTKINTDFIVWPGLTVCLKA